MTQNQRQALLICGVAAAMFGGLAWFIPAAKEPGVWWFRIGGLLVFGSVILIFRWLRTRSDSAPDFLSTITETFLEQDGFAFIVSPEVINGMCHLCVQFQNRYERACEATVLVRTSERWLSPQRHLPDAKLTLTCLPGAFGKALVPWPLPQELQGKNVLLDVMAKRKYRNGRGKLLRHRVGLQVGSVPASPFSDVLGILGVLGGIHSHRPARTELQLPRDVSSSQMPAAEVRIETLWKLGDPTISVMENALIRPRESLCETTP